MRLIWMLIFLAAPGLAWANQPLTPVDEVARSEWQRSSVPGVAYAYIEDDEIRAGAHGESEAGRGDAVTGDTPFPLGSISKSFTALAIMQRVEAGQLRLDDAISTHLPAFADGPGQAITLRQLLSHTSGYSTLQGNENRLGQDIGEDVLQRQVEQIAGWTPAKPPGQSWAYSNANYLILGAVIERVTGRSYADYIQTEILDPLGMSRSFVADGSTRPEMVAAHLPWFGGRWALRSRETDRLNAPAGGVIASARDVAVYLGMMMNQQDDLISAEHKALMMRPASEVAPFYGLGWYVDTTNQTVSHTGLIPGIETLAIMRPAEGQAAVVLVNASGGLGFGETYDLRYAVALRAVGLDFYPGGGVWGRKTLTLTFWVLPLLFVYGIAIAGFKRAGLRSKAGLAGQLSLWFPLAISLALAWVCLALLPSLFGVSIATLSRYQPDWTIGLWASAASGIVWAVFRLAVYHTAGQTLDDRPR